MTLPAVVKSVRLSTIDYHEVTAPRITLPDRLDRDTGTEACRRFVLANGSVAAIGALVDAEAVLLGEAGTTIRA